MEVVHLINIMQPWPISLFVRSVPHVASSLSQTVLVFLAQQKDDTNPKVCTNTNLKAS